MTVIDKSVGGFLLWMLAACGVSSIAFPARAAPPDLSGLLPFTAREPYELLVNGVPRTITLGGTPRRFQFAPVTSLINPQTGQPDIATLLTGEASVVANHGGVLAGATIPAAGVSGRVEIVNSATVTAYRAGDIPVAGKARTQIASFPVPSRTTVVWELEFSLGKEGDRTGWPSTPPGIHPVTIWQLKAHDTNPSLVLTVDTESTASGTLNFVFARRGGAASSTARIAEVGGVSRFKKQRLVMEAFLDEREVSVGGKGYWRAWLNDVLVVDSFGPTLSSKANDPHQWFLATYLFNDPLPVGDSWVAVWSRAKMFLSN